jgi:flagellar hook-associated protein 2
MSTISFGGLASGLDTTAIINALMGVERAPLTAIQKRQSDVLLAQSTVSGIASKLANVKSAALALSTPQGFSAFRASSSDAAVVATVTGAASAGAYDITVSKLAKEERRYSASQTSSTTALGMAGSLSIQVGTGTAANLTIAATDSLTDVASKINASGLRVGASVIYDGTAYKLQLRGLDTGASKALTVGESGFTLGLNDVGAVKQVAQNAEVLLDGQTITRSTNQLTGILPGVTLTLAKETTSPATVRIESEPESLKTKISNLVKAYNEAVFAGQSAAGTATLKPTNSLLAGDSSIRSAFDRVARTLSQPVAGATGKYTTLGSVGVKTNREGRLEFDEVAFGQALAADPSGVAKIFVTDPSAGTTGAMTPLMNAIDQAAVNSNSTLKTRADSLGSASARLTRDAEALERRLSLLEQQLQSRFTMLESMMSKIKAQGNSLAGITSPSTNQSR